MQGDGEGGGWGRNEAAVATGKHSLLVGHTAPQSSLGEGVDPGWQLSSPQICLCVPTQGWAELWVTELWIKGNHVERFQNKSLACKISIWLALQGPKGLRFCVCGLLLIYAQLSFNQNSRDRYSGSSPWVNT